MIEGDHNKVTVTFEWPPDKWMGFDSWKDRIGALLRMADLLGLDDGRPSMTIVTERVGLEEDK